MDIKSKYCKGCCSTKSREEFGKLSGSQYKSSWDVRDSLCKPCRTKYQTNRRKEIKQKAVKYLGEVCIDCGLKSHNYSIYDFHHIDPNTKDVQIGSSGKSFASLKKELDKCILLCANCHRIRHSN